MQGKQNKRTHVLAKMQSDQMGYCSYCFRKGDYFITTFLFYPSVHYKK